MNGDEQTKIRSLKRRMCFRNVFSTLPATIPETAAIVSTD